MPGIELAINGPSLGKLNNADQVQQVYGRTPSNDAAPGVNRRDRTTQPDKPSQPPSVCELRSLPSLVGTPTGARSDQGAGGVQSGVLQRYDPKTGLYRKVGR